MKTLAIQGSYTDLRFIKSRKVAAITVEIPIEAADSFVRMFGSPNPATECPVALARIKQEAAEWTSGSSPSPSSDVRSHSPTTSSVSRRKWDGMPASQQAALRCQNPEFQQWLGVSSSDAAAEKVRDRCGVLSRSELNSDERARIIWDRMNDDFWLWRRGANV